MDELTSKALREGYNAIVESQYNGMTGVRQPARWNTPDIENPYRKALVVAIGKKLWPHIKSMSPFCGLCSSDIILEYANVAGYKAFKRRFGRDFVESKTVDFSANTSSSELIDKIDYALPNDGMMPYVATIHVTNPFDESRLITVANPYPPPKKYPNCRQS